LKIHPFGRQEDTVLSVQNITVLKVLRLTEFAWTQRIQVTQTARLHYLKVSIVAIVVVRRLVLIFAVDDLSNE